MLPVAASFQQVTEAPQSRQRARASSGSPELAMSSLSPNLLCCVMELEHTSSWGAELERDADTPHQCDYQYQLNTYICYAL